MCITQTLRTYCFMCIAIMHTFKLYMTEMKIGNQWNQIITVAVIIPVSSPSSCHRHSHGTELPLGRKNYSFKAFYFYHNLKIHSKIFAAGVGIRNDIGLTRRFACFGNLK